MLLAVRISSYGCTWEVPQLDIRTRSMNKFLILIRGSQVYRQATFAKIK